MIRDTPVVKAVREALVAEPSPEARAHHLERIHETLQALAETSDGIAESADKRLTALERDVAQLVTQSHAWNAMLVEHATKPIDTDRYVAVRRELKARCLADALMELVTTSGAGDDLTYRDAAAAALAASYESIWNTTLSIANQGRPDSFGPPSDQTIERVRTILAHRAGES
jgi:hypothetical protein